MEALQKKTKSLLVNPPAGKVKLADGNTGEYFFPYSLIYVMNYVIGKGFEVDLYDMYMDPPEELDEQIRNMAPDVVGVTAHATNRFHALDVLRHVKESFPNIITTMGGRFCSAKPGFAAEILRSEPYIDVIVVEEGEITFHELLEAIENNESIDDIKGIAYRKKSGEVVENERRKEHRNLDDFTIDYNRLPKKVQDRYSASVILRNYEKEGIKSYSMMLGRGCVGRCVFCGYGWSDVHCRTRTVDDCLSEITAAKEHYGTKYFTFSDPSFCNKVGFVEKLCNALIEGGYNIQWYCESRVDTPLRILKLMKEAGCISVDFGVESGSPRVLEAIGKKINLDMVLKFGNACKRLGIRAGCFFMISLPDEKEEDALLTKQLIRELIKGGFEIRLAATSVFPNTPLYGIALERGLLPDGFSWLDREYHHSHSFVRNRDIPPYFEHLSPAFIQSFVKGIGTLLLAEMSSIRLLGLAGRNLGRILRHPSWFVSKGLEVLRSRKRIDG